MDPGLYECFYAIEDRFWWSVGTRRVFFRLIRSLPMGERERVLDVGCGTGVTLAEFPPGSRIAAGCDLSERALAFCRRRGLADLVRCDATRLAYRSGSADLVLALDVIEHVDDDLACLGELARACRSGGHVLLHVPALPALWSDKDVLNHHRRRYRRRDLVALVERAHLSIERMLYVNAALVPVALARSAWQRLSGRRAAANGRDTSALDGLYRVPEVVNRALLAWMEIERRIGERVPLPIGMSLVCLARKP
jgi:SAM-dependent methyltransferase